MSTDFPAGRSRAGLISLACAEALWLAILLVLPLVMNVSLVRTFEASKLGAVAPLTALGLAALAAGALSGGFAGMRKMLLGAPVLCFAGLMAIAALATAASETPWIAFFGDYFRREGLISWLTYGVLFGTLLLALRRREQLDRIVDVLLLSTIVPCVYAVMQRYGWDFFSTRGLLVGTTGARPGGTMGNPVFLASLLLLIIPLTAARVLAPARPPRPGEPPLRRYLSLSRGLSLLFLGLQIFTVILSQSRGPDLGLAVALALFMLLAGAWRRHRLPIAVALAAALALAAGLAAINLVPALVHAVEGTPLQRFVFSGGGTEAGSRPGIWQAGVNVFVHAPWWRQWLGWGPDSASFSYFQWIPAAVQRQEGFAQTIDRMHSQFFEVLQSFGILGLALQIGLMAALVWTTAARLLPAPAAALPARLGFVALNLAGLALGGAIAAGAGGSTGFAPIGAGAGLAVAWILFFAWRAWRSLGAAAPAAALASEDGLLIAALTSALIGSWVETLVGVPTIATLSVIAVYAALIVLAAHDVWRSQAPPAAPSLAAAPATAQAPAANRRKARKIRPPAPRVGAAAATPGGVIAYPVLGWAAGLTLMIAVADFFPPLTGARIMPPSVLKLPLIVWPLALMVLCGLALSFAEARRGGADAQSVLTRFLLWCALPALVFTSVYFSLGDGLTDLALADVADRVATLVELGYAACLAMPVLLAVALYRAGPATRDSARRAAWTAPALLAAGVLLCLTTFAAVRADVGADVRSKLTSWALNQGRPDEVLRFAREAWSMVPAERRYATTYAGRLSQDAGADFPSLAARPETVVSILAKLKEAERILAEAKARTPRDPWVNIAYAMVEQHLALPALAPYLPTGEHAQHAAAASKYFALANQQFPVQPFFLVNWTQHEMDQGNRAAAYAKLIDLEKLEPRSSFSYANWVRYAGLGGNAQAEAVAAIRRGLAAVPKNSDDAAELLEMQIEIARNAGQVGQALSEALEAIRTGPERIRAWRQLAELYELTGRLDLALGNAQNALARFGGHNLAGTDAVDFAALQTLVARLLPGAARTPPAALKAPPGASSTTMQGAAAPAESK